VEIVFLHTVDPSALSKRLLMDAVVSAMIASVGAVSERPLELLHVIAGPDAEFRAGQREAIHAVVDERRRVLLVQRTGWGKSAVYFIATRLLRDAGAGPTILVSPLLASAGSNAVRPMLHRLPPLSRSVMGALGSRR
jgi:superfamily II DNA helicase RecQ